jgi:hypothetical protein
MHPTLLFYSDSFTHQRESAATQWVNFGQSWQKTLLYTDYAHWQVTLEQAYSRYEIRRNKAVPQGNFMRAYLQAI